jgi:hypothetical protein
MTIELIFALIGFEFGFSSILKYGIEVDNWNIDHPKLIPLILKLYGTCENPCGMKH